MMCFECVEDTCSGSGHGETEFNRSFMDYETFSHVSCMLYSLSSDYFNRTTWPLVLGKLFLVPMKNVENTWPERI